MQTVCLEHQNKSDLMIALEERYPGNANNLFTRPCLERNYKFCNAIVLQRLKMVTKPTVDFQEKT